MEKRAQYYRPLLVFTLLAIAFCLPIFKNFQYWGIEDWDEYFFRNGLARITILKYHQFPLWNPYTCGGNVFLAHPTSSFLSPFFIFILLFGEVIGLKIQIVTYLITGMFGMFLLSKHLKLEKYSSYLPSFIYMLSGIYVLHATAGLVGEFTMALIPYVFLFYLKSIKDRMYILAAIVSLSLIILGGSLRVVVIFSLFLLVHGFFLALKRRKIYSLIVVALIFIGAFLLCGIKTVPVTEFFMGHPRIIDSPKGVDLAQVYTMLFKKVSTFDPPLFPGGHSFNIQYDWYHCGAYIGFLPFVLAIFGMMFNFRHKWPLILTGMTFLFIVLGEQSSINLWKFIHSIPIFSALHTPPRFVLGLILPISIFAGLGLTKLEGFLSKKPLLLRLAIPIVVLSILLDLMSSQHPIFKEAFTIQPKKMERNVSFYQGTSHLDYLKSDSDVYPRFLSNRGTINAEEVDNIYPSKRNVLSKSADNYRGEVYLAGEKGRIGKVAFSPNKIIVDIDIIEDDILILNQNYIRGWKVRKSGKILKAQSFKQLIAIPVSNSDKTAVFYYLPSSFIVGGIVSVLTISVMFMVMLLGKRKRRLV